MNSSAIPLISGKMWQFVKALEGNPKGWYCCVALHPVKDDVLLGYGAMSGLAHPRITRVPSSWLDAETASGTPADRTAAQDLEPRGFFAG